MHTFIYIWNPCTSLWATEPHSVFHKAWPCLSLNPSSWTQDNCTSLQYISNQAFPLSPAFWEIEGQSVLYSCLSSRSADCIQPVTSNETERLIRVDMQTHITHMLILLYPNSVHNICCGRMKKKLAWKGKQAWMWHFLRYQARIAIAF